MGLGNPRTVRALSRIKILKNPNMVFLMETKLKDLELEKIRVSCGFSNCPSVSCIGEERENAGGLALLWNNSLNIIITSYSPNHIEVFFVNKETGKSYMY